VNWLRHLWLSFVGERPDPATVRPASPAHQRSLQRADRLLEDAERRGRDGNLRDSYSEAGRRLSR
jgi:hypothetical protein